MIFLLYKPIIGLSPRFALVSDVRRISSVALTAQGSNSTEHLNRIYRPAAPARFSPGQINQFSFSCCFLPSLAPHAVQPIDRGCLNAMRFTCFHVNKSERDWCDAASAEFA
jgi:hypothetical protein